MAGWLLQDDDTLDVGELGEVALAGPLKVLVVFLSRSLHGVTPYRGLPCLQGDLLLHYHIFLCAHGRVERIM